VGNCWPYTEDEDLFKIIHFMSKQYIAEKIISDHEETKYNHGPVSTGTVSVVLVIHFLP
jgi:hypothetical protein